MRLWTQLTSLRAYSPLWWFLTLVGVVYFVLTLTGCQDSTGPDPEPVVTMQQLEKFQNAAMKAYGYSTGSGICDPAGDNDSPGKIPEVNACFSKLLWAFGVGGTAVASCAAAAGSSGTVAAAIGAWSVCGMQVMNTSFAAGQWWDATQLDAMADWSENEIAERMRQTIFERMVARGIWDD